MLYNRLLPFIAAIGSLIGLELLLYSHQALYYVLILVSFFQVAILWRYAKSSNVNKEWWRFSILPVVFFSSAVLYISLLKLDNFYLIQFLFGLVTVLLYFYFRFCYYYLLRPNSYKVGSIESLSIYVNFLSFYFTAASLYGLGAFLNISIWPLILGLAIVTLLVVYQLFWASKIDLKHSAVEFAIICLCLMESALAFSFWPLNYHVVGLSLAVCYYVLVSLLRFKLLDDLDKQKIKYYLTFAGISLALLWLTARWL
ncbi:hypothetical protein HGA64_00480 [Candidatus Falkowbacteria bacterium]|nr:hypothetical protein [Candidatus Falkowbacteria bacterium]